MTTNKPELDAFISHASHDTAVAGRIEEALEKDGQSAWLDRSDIRLGVLLRDELRSAIDNSRVLILLWSKPAGASRWVASEILTAFHLNRFIIPCVLDDTRLPQFLENTVYLDLRREEALWMASLCRAVRNAPNAANTFSAVIASRSSELWSTIQTIARGQQEEMIRLQQRNPGGAQEIHNQVDELMQKSEKAWPLDLMILNLAGYHRKNAYLLKHWDAVQAGRPPEDPLLEHAERFFFEALFVDPTDYSALNGLGSVLILERELDAAEFFVRRAIAYGERDKLDYSAARRDLETIHYHRQRTRG